MSERTAVQNPMIQYAHEAGWEYVDRDEAAQMRGGTTGLFFDGILEAQLHRLNPGVIDTARAAEVIRQLKLIPATIEGNRTALSWIRGERSIFAAENRERNVRLIDFDDPGNNLYQVTDEWVQKGVVKSNRADVMFLINGIPVALCETKQAGKPDGLAEGVEQVRRYHRQTPELFVSTQVFEVTQLFDFFYGATWNTSKKNIFNWKDEQPGDYERKVKAFFDERRFLKVLREYIVFMTKDDVLTKVILRQHQTRAVEKVVDRVYHPHKRRGLIWHTQGSGKTLTMITIAAKLLRESRGAEKPTVLMLIDRTELETQMARNIAAYGIPTYKVAASKKDLLDILKSDYRGLVVTMIHKFDDIPKDVNTRHSIIVLADEAHRSTGGDLGNYLMAALPNARYIGFTGTPIDDLGRGRGTFKVFGQDDEQGYLDKYSIAESVEDGTTVALNYALAPSHLRVDKETLEKEFLNLAAAQGVADVEELNAILDRAVKLKEMMKSPPRMAEIAALVAKDFRERVEPMGFKAFVVAVDREACALYKKELDKHLPPEYSVPIYSGAQGDEPPVSDYLLNEDEEKKVRREFAAKGTLPKILIVTEKLLTGYDAPILYCMYLDKPMRDHVLLQAIARVNRPYEDEEGLVKPHGYVLDFVGIFDNVKKALSFDADVVASVIQNIDVLKDRFELLMKGEARQYLGDAKLTTDKDVEQAVEKYQGKDARKKFFSLFRQVEDLYEILSPDACLRPYIDDYQKLASLYAMIRGADRMYVDRELTAKTRELLKRRTTGTTPELPNAVRELGAEQLAALRRSDSSDTVKVLNLKKAIRQAVEEQQASKPYLVSIGERAEKLAQAYEDRQVSTKQLLIEFENLAQQYVDADAERQRLDVDDNTFAVYNVLKLAGGGTVDQAKGINALFEKYPDYQWHEQQKSRLRAELYKALRPVVGTAKMIDVANTLLRLQRV